MSRRCRSLSVGSSWIAAAAASCGCWNRPEPSGSKRPNTALGWVDVRGVVSRTPLRDTGRRIDVPVAVATWVGAFVIGQLASALIIGASGAEDLDSVPIPTLFA